MPILKFLKKKPGADSSGTPQAPEASLPMPAAQGTKGGHAISLPFHITPLVTEKSTALQALHQYSLQAPFTTTKTQVGILLKNMFHVHPLKIRSIPMAGKYVRYGRASGKTRRWKKYIVQLAASEKLDMDANKIH